MDHMDFSYAGAAPSIRVYDSNPHIDRYAIPRRASYVSSRSSATSSPMSIPNARESPPPPLPPPRHISELANGRDPGWQWGNSLNIGHNQLSEVKPGSSLLGYWSKRPEKSVQDEEQNALDFARRGSSTSTIKVEHDADVPMSEGDGSGSAGGLDYRFVTHMNLPIQFLLFNIFLVFFPLICLGKIFPKQESIKF